MKINREIIKEISIEIDELLEDNPAMEDLYSIFKINKLNGYRVICAPCQQLKITQRKIYTHILLPYYNHFNKNKECAHGFLPGKGTLTNASPHMQIVRPASMIRVSTLCKENPYLYKTQFPSAQVKNVRNDYLFSNDISVESVAKAVEKNETASVKEKSILFKADIKGAFQNTSTQLVREIFEEIFVHFSDKEFITYTEKFTKICTLYGGLPQGAPTSPSLLNLILSDLDKMIKNIFSRKKLHIFFGGETNAPPSEIVGYECNYTRYADDIALSFNLKYSGDECPRISKKRVASEITRVLARLGYQLNKKKTRLFTKKHGFKITGVTLGGAAPTVSRKRFYIIKAKINNFIYNHYKGLLSDDQYEKELNQIGGELAYVSGLDYIKAASLYRYTTKRNLAIFTKTSTNYGEFAKIYDDIHNLRKAGPRSLASDQFNKATQIRKILFSTGGEKRVAAVTYDDVPF